MSMIHDLHMALCAHHPKSNYPLPPYIWPPLAFTTPLPLPSGKHHTVFYVYEFLFLCFSYLCLYSFQLYMTHLSEIIWFLTFSIWLTLLSMIFSRSSHKNKYYLLLYFKTKNYQDFFKSTWLLLEVMVKRGF